MDASVRDVGKMHMYGRSGLRREWILTSGETVPVSCHDGSCLFRSGHSSISFWSHHEVKFDLTVDLTGFGNRSDEVIK